MLWIRDELSNNALIRLCVNKIPNTLRKHLAQRKEIGSKAVMKQVSKAIITQHNEYLLQLRDDHPGIFYANQWSFFGGGLEIGETPWQTLQRELFEELEWCPEDGRFLYQWSNPDHPSCIHFFVVPFEGDRNQLVLHQSQNCNGSVLKRWYRKEKWRHTFFCM